MTDNIGNQFFNRLEGTWENRWDGKWLDDLGWNFISQPKRGAKEDSDFEMRVDQMREKIVFTKLGGTANNVGVTGKVGHWVAMSYEVSIQNPDGEPIHHEMGHFLLKAKNESGEAHKPFKSTIIRQATIPRANAMMTLGELKPGAIDPDPKHDIYSALPQAVDPNLQSDIEREFSSKQNIVTQKKGPDLTKPLGWLAGKFKQKQDRPDFEDWVFDFRHDLAPSQMSNGQRVENPVGIGNLLSEFWIGSRKINNTPVHTLQYAQKVDLIFNGMRWPHTAVNTLIRKRQ